jgi:hypothetical protein
MKRYGPLLAVSDALALGDPGRHHLRLTPDGIIVREGAEYRDILLWDRVSGFRLDVPTTRFRLPGLVTTLGLGVLTLISVSDIGVDPDDGSVEITVDGEAMRLPLSRHHVGGYWERTIVGTHRLLDHLIAHPAQRALLTRPQSLVDVAAKLARSNV